MREQNPAKIANRYFDLCIKFASNFSSYEPEDRLRMRKRLHNLSKITGRLASEGKIKLKTKKSLNEVWRDSTDNLIVYDSN